MKASHFSSTGMAVVVGVGEVVGLVDLTVALGTAMVVERGSDALTPTSVSS